jgi:hypothetical protein
VLDCRDLGEGFPKDNLTPRGLILNLGHNLWACFDTDLLRIACIWEGEPGKPPVTPDALAPGSYHIAGQKTKDGQEYLPKPVGKVWLANGIYPGWQVGDKPSFNDPREPAPSKEEVGRGSLGEKSGTFKSVVTTKDGVCLEYTIAGIDVRDWLGTDEQGTMIGRLLEVGPSKQKLNLAIGDNDFDQEETLKNVPKERAAAFRSNYKKGNASELQHDLFRIEGLMDNLHVLSIEPHEQTIALQFTIYPSSAVIVDLAKQKPNNQVSSTLWPRTVATTATLGTAKSSYAIDDIPLPFDNPWKRNVRLADIAFLNDQGDAAGVTFDGDVWLISGLKGDLEKVTWKRFASGLHEPMSIVSRGTTKSWSSTATASGSWWTRMATRNATAMRCSATSSRRRRRRGSFRIR